MLKSQSGLSLLELVLGLGLSSLLLLSSSTVFLHQQQLLLQQIKRTQLLIASHHLAIYLRGEIRRAGHGHSSALEVGESKMAIGYREITGEYRRVSIWRDSSQYKLKYCSDSHLSELPLLETCSGNINFSMLNDKLFSVRGFEVANISGVANLLRIDYAIAIKGQVAMPRVVYVATRNRDNYLQGGVDDKASQ